MKATELKQKSIMELKEQLMELTRAAFRLRMQKGSGALVKADSIKKIRRDIARVKTVLTEKNLVSE